MEVAQVSVFLENRAGGLASILDVLARERIDVGAISVADMEDIGILRLIVPDAERARAVLRTAGFTAELTPVIAVEIPDRPGGLAETLHVLRDRGINLEYMYSASRRRGESAIVILRVDDGARTVAALRAAGVKVLETLEAL